MKIYGAKMRFIEITKRIKSSYNILLNNLPPHATIKRLSAILKAFL
ncbi:hypothetical protein C7475_1151 [Chitinophaga sp. S165]|nr:hypothetical protein C7475_1151 [Chitinophaga sp. S165]